MRIRPYSVTDYESVMAINKQCFAFPPPDHVLIQEIREGRCWVVDAHTKVVGFLVANFKKGLPYIYSIAVHPDMSNLGIGSRLLDEFEKHFKSADYKRAWLQVEANNRAQTLYFKHGYRVQSLIKDYYGEGKDALCMYKQL